MEQNKRFIIAIEGNEFSGKTTIAGKLVTELQKLGVMATYARLPGTSPIGEQLRPIVKNVVTSPATQLGIALAGHTACYDHFNSDQEFLRSNAIILDRNLESILVYQGFLDKLYLTNPTLVNNVISTLKQHIDENFHLIRVYLKTPIEKLIERRNAKEQSSTRDTSAADKFDNLPETKIKDLNDYYDIAFSDKYDSLLGKYKIVIDCSLETATIDNIVADIIRVLQPKENNTIPANRASVESVVVDELTENK